MKPPARLFLLFAVCLFSCTSADPTLVARAVNATLSAVPTPTPIVVVVTIAIGQGTSIPSVTPDVSAAAATETPTASATAQPSATPTDTPAASGSPPVPVRNVIFEDDFSEPGQWEVGEDDLQRIAVADGQLSLALKVSDRFSILFNTRRRARDFFASVTGATAACLFRDRYGLLFRVLDASNYYQFDVDCDGRYRLAKLVGGTLAPLRDWTPHPAIRPGGAVNELGVRAAGNTLEVFVNGQSLSSVNDSTYTEGAFGLYAGSGLSSAYTATFDNLRVWEVQP